MSEKIIHSYKDLIVWQKSVDLVIAVYKLTSVFPKDEIYGLISQMKRSAVSIPANIAEGRRRGTRKDFRQFLLIAYGSGSELETYLIITERLMFGDVKSRLIVLSILEEVMKMLNVMIFKLQNPTPKATN